MIFLKYTASTLNLKDDPELIHQYIEHHRNISQEQIDGMKSIGINRLKIFLRGRRMFMFIETTDDYPKRKPTPEESRKGEKWQQLMHRFQEQLPDSPPDIWWAPMEEIFDLETA